MKKCHKDIAREFAGLSDRVLSKFLGEFDTPRLRLQMKKHGDGQVLCSLPSAFEELNDTDVVVLIAVTSPKLSAESDFNRFTPLHAIPYWRDGMRLRPQIGPQRLHFMSWQQNHGTHGVDDEHAGRNYKLLVANNRNLMSLFEQEKNSSIRFINHCREWVDGSGKRMVVITHYARKRFDEPISSLIDSPNVSHIITSLRGRNHTIMRKINDVLAG